MSVPPEFIDELRLRTSLSQVVGRKVSWDSRKSNPARGDMWAPCPFHQEKTASFHVDDKKGFYYCFGCHAKGNVFSFLRESENVSFMEAVKILADEAGMVLPAPDKAHQEKANRRDFLCDIVEQALQFYRLQLKLTEAGPAREYLEKRGLDQGALKRFEIGFAPDKRTVLFEHLRGKSLAEDDIIEAGLAAKSDRGGAIYDRFQGRIIFPIRDSQSRAIAFGGRALSPAARAKYLNSPETPIFSKGRSLYNFVPARKAAGKGQTLLVTEGYMDVIALSCAGFEACVAPLGTAITQAQIALLWRLSSTPVFAFDGDKAGLNAAFRLIELALPQISAERSLRFCIMPEGLDPDDVIRNQGAAAMQALIENALPLIDMIWRRETADKTFRTPEERAGLQMRLSNLIAQISDVNLRRQYEGEIKNRLWLLFRAPPPERRKKSRNNKNQLSSSASVSARQSFLASKAGDNDKLIEDTILSLILRYPALLEDFSERLADYAFSPSNVALGNELILFQGAESELYAHIQEKFGANIENLFAQRHLLILPPLLRDDPELARQTLEDIFMRIAAKRGIEIEIQDAEQDILSADGENLTYRLKMAADALGGVAQETDANEKLRDEDEKKGSEFLQNLIDNQVWVKKKG